MLKWNWMVVEMNAEIILNDYNFRWGMIYSMIYSMSWRYTEGLNHKI